MLKRVKELFEVIKNAEAELKKIRDKCKHKKTFEGNWSDGPGRITHANICFSCHNFVSVTGKFPDMPEFHDGGWKQSNITLQDPKRGDWFEAPE